MSSQRDYWNNMFDNKRSEIRYDDWLDKHQSIFEASAECTIVEIGCGRGGNTLYLVERGYSVVACDISDIAIAGLQQRIPEAKPFVCDILAGLPFADESTQVVIADLCLHYFSWIDTVRVLADIARVLRPGGHLLCRVNSTKDSSYGAGQGEEIEPSYYRVNGTEKRFFDRPQLERLFADWDINHMAEYQMTRFGHPKTLWEVAARKR